MHSQKRSPAETDGRARETDRVLGGTDTRGNTQSAAKPQDQIVSTQAKSARAVLEFVIRRHRGSVAFMVRTRKRDGRGNLQPPCSGIGFSPNSLRTVLDGLAALEAAAKREGII